MKFFHKPKDNVQDFRVDLLAQCTNCIWNNLVGPPCVKSGYWVPIPVRSDRVLCFIPIMKRFLHSTNRLHHSLKQCTFKSSDPLQIIPDFPPLEFQLFFIVHLLNLASTALSCHRAFCLFPFFRRLDNFHQSGITVILFQLCNSCLDHIADNRILHKESHPFGFPDSFSSYANILYCQCHKIIFLHRFFPFCAIIHSSVTADHSLICFLPPIIPDFPYAYKKKQNRCPSNPWLRF